MEERALQQKHSMCKRFGLVLDQEGLFFLENNKKGEVCALSMLFKKWILLRCQQQYNI